MSIHIFPHRLFEIYAAVEVYIAKYLFQNGIQLKHLFQQGTFCTQPRTSESILVHWQRKNERYVKFMEIQHQGIKAGKE